MGTTCGRFELQTDTLLLIPTMVDAVRMLVCVALLCFSFTFHELQRRKSGYVLP